jgi:putative nucleotidyltransferase with HDIG domain
MTGVVQQTSCSLASRVRALLEADDVQLPPLPEVATRVQQILSSDEADMGELDRLLSQDPAIVAALLRLANSAVFGGLRRVENLSMAIQRIGFRQLGAIVTGLSVKGHFCGGTGVKKELLEALWDHSVATGFAARAIALLVGAESEKAFLAGLLHDSGKVLVLTAVNKLEEHGFAEPPTRDVLIELMDELHAELGSRILTEWNLPTDLADVARLHEDDAPVTDQLLACVKAANLITRKLGYHLDPDPEMSVIEDPIIENLGLDDITVASMMVDMEDHLLEMKQLF